MIELTEATQGLWFVNIPGGDWLGSIARTEEGFELIYRFRYYRGPEVWNSDDLKRWTTVTGKPFERGLAAVREIVGQLVRVGKMEHWELLRGTESLDSFAEQWAAMPFSHTKRLNQQEYETLLATGRVPE